MKRHRGTWSTAAMILVLALGTCLTIMGIFNLATDALYGLGMIALGVGLIIPGVWWIRWYQKPQILRRLLLVSFIFVGLGITGLFL